MTGERRCKKRERPWIFRDLPGFLDLYVRFYFRNISHSKIIKKSRILSSLSILYKTDLFRLFWISFKNKCLPRFRGADLIKMGNFLPMLE
jgi:hypothetical protein